ncbi:amino acid permease [Limosilactobacillus sp.]|uniref:amino acid permease n=1 Tax=Limosilactobacillus sp. TaxID=2773925 RepID=UPI00345E8EEE
MNKQKPTLERNLKGRHVQMIALGGTIGTGLFLGAGKTIHVAGPSIVLSYLLTGIICFLLMRAMGELLLSNLNYRTFIEPMRDYLGERTAFVAGWVYWACWVAIAMAEVTAIGMYIQLWLPHCPQWIPGLLTILILVCINLITVKAFGEVEFWFAMIKVVAILFLIGVGIVLMLMRFRTPNGYMSTPANLLKYGGFFPTGTKGFLLSFQMVVFAFAGIEMIGMTAAETANPRKIIPKAINEIPTRILLFYIGSLLIIMCIYPWNKLPANASPFVMVFKAIGIPGAASLINFVVITAAASACNSSLYTTGRMLAELTSQSRRPTIQRISRLSKKAVPARAIVVSAVIIALSSLLNYFIPSSVFTLVSSVATTSFLFIWGLIILTDLKYQQKHPESKGMPFAPYSNWLVLIFFAFVAVVLCLSEDTFVALLLSVAVIAVVSVASLAKSPH